MRTLTSDKVRRMVHEIAEGDNSIYRISKRYNITPQHCRRLYARFSNMPSYEIRLSLCGRKPVPLTGKEIGNILQCGKITLQLVRFS